MREKDSRIERTLRFGWPDEFIPQGPVPVLMERYGLRADRIADAVAARLAALRG